MLATEIGEQPMKNLRYLVFRNTHVVFVSQVERKDSEGMDNVLSILCYDVRFEDSKNKTPVIGIAQNS